VAVQDLWNGADVRWVGPETMRGGVRLRPSVRAVVLEAGRHHLTSVGLLRAPVEGGPARAGPWLAGRGLGGWGHPAGGVMIRLQDGAVVSVPREHLELVAPDHPLAPEPDGTVAGWWLEQLDPWGAGGVPVSSLVPAGFPAVCQVVHPWFGPDGEVVRWRTLAEGSAFRELRERYQTSHGLVPVVAEELGLSGSEGELDVLTARALVEVLSDATATPDQVFVAVWEGWGDVPPQRFPGAAHIHTQARGHFLLRGPLTGVLSPVAIASADRPAAGLWWPADRAWFVATEIDFPWTFVAGATALVDRLLNDDRLEAATTTFDASANRAADPRW
jgi:hypothetical protein